MQMMSRVDKALYRAKEPDEIALNARYDFLVMDKFIR